MSALIIGNLVRLPSAWAKAQAISSMRVMLTARPLKGMGLLWLIILFRKGLIFAL